MPDLSDETLMHRYGRGEMKSFQVLYDRYREPLYRYFLRHVSNDTVANDLYQGCWEKIIKARERYKRSTPFRAWLFRIAHNHLVDYYRVQKPVTELKDTLAGEEADQPHERLDSQSKQERFKAALLSLPTDQRDTLLLRLESGLSMEQVSEVMGVGMETTKSRLRYASRKLKMMLQS